MDFTEERPCSNKRLDVLQEQPLNAEPDVAALVEHAYTPDELVYCRNHSPIKSLDIDTFSLKIGGAVKNELELRLKDLRESFSRVEVVAALQCAGNRRKTMSERKHKDVDGVKWNEGVVCNVKWAGAPIREILLAAGVQRPSSGAPQMQLCAASYVTACQDDGWYGSSVPLEKAMDVEGDVLLAYEMNGHPLLPEHGSPFRLIVPGYTGARWVKWVDRIHVSEHESDNYYQQQDYKILPEEVDSRDKAKAWWSKTSPLQLNPLNSVVASVSHRNGQSLSVEGYALPGPTGQVKSVDVSIDLGKTWKPASIVYQEGKWSWTLWKIVIDIQANTLASGNSVRVWSRATDESGAIQPSDCAWNLRGLGYCGFGWRNLNNIEESAVQHAEGK